MHRLLARQLRKLNLDSASTLNAEQLESLLQRVSDTYQQADDDRYLLERSLQISSDEMQSLFEQQRITAEGRLQALINALPDLVFMLDEEGRYVEIIAGEESHLYLPVDKLKGKLISEIMPPEQAAFFIDAIKRSIENNALELMEYELPVPIGVRTFEGRIMPTGLKVNQLQTVLFLARDITELAQSSEELKHLATHDRLTGLPNRALLTERLVQAISRAKRHGKCGALLLLDLDRFKKINDSLGHATGDELLKQVALRLQSVSRVEDTVVRFGGDEFVLILEDLRDAIHAGLIAQHILDAFTAPIQLSGTELHVTTSIGISIFPDDGEEEASLLNQADNAMYAAKEAGRNQYSFYTEKLGTNILAYLALESRLRKAINNKELILLYQPQFNMITDTLVGFEALVRWPSAGLENIKPETFIPAAEISGLIEPLGLWVFNEACRQAAIWQQHQFEFGRLAVNLSSRQLSNPRLAEQIENVLQSYQLSGNYFECEITESMVVQEGDVIHRNLEAISAMGIHLAIDDFGTGHSSLANLKRFPLNRLKIDRSFVDGLGKEANDEAITGASIALARQFGLNVVAEGVETMEQVAFLIQHGCDVAQGFLYAKPMSPEEIEQRFRENSQMHNKPEKTLSYK